MGYCFVEQWKLSLRHVTRVGQKLSGHLQQIKEDTTTAINAMFFPGVTLENVSPHFISSWIKQRFTLNPNQRALSS
jgi:hypothetical protein